MIEHFNTVGVIVSHVELSMVIEQQLGPDGMRQAEAFFRRAGVVTEPVTLDQGRIRPAGLSGFCQRPHKASLNFVDCFSYALAKAMGEPLLFKGKDFSHTDIKVA